MKYIQNISDLIVLDRYDGKAMMFFDYKENVLYVFKDYISSVLPTDDVDAENWFCLEVSDERLVAFLRGEVPLLRLVEEAFSLKKLYSVRCWISSNEIYFVFQ